MITAVSDEPGTWLGLQLLVSLQLPLTPDAHVMVALLAQAVKRHVANTRIRSKNACFMPVVPPEAATFLPASYANFARKQGKNQRFFS
jgi:hypothetical protein